VKINRSFMALAAGLVLVLTSGVSRAAPLTWVGDTLNVQFLSPNLQTVFYNNNFTVPTANTPIAAPTANTNPLPDILILNIQPTSLSLSLGGPEPLFISDAPTVFKVTDLTASRILNAVLQPTDVTPPASVISGNNFFQIDLTGAVFGPVINDSSITVDVSFMDPVGTPAVPEPASLPLLGSGLLSLAAVLWTRKRQAAGPPLTGTAECKQPRLRSHDASRNARAALRGWRRRLAVGISTLSPPSPE